MKIENSSMNHGNFIIKYLTEIFENHRQKFVRKAGYVPVQFSLFCYIATQNLDTLQGEWGDALKRNENLNAVP